MATMQQPLAEGFTGKVGKVVGVSYNGMQVIRSLPRKTNAKPSAAQMTQREKFGIVQQFLNPINPLISLYFGLKETEQSRRSTALSYHLREAILSLPTGFEIDYRRVIITKGELLGLDYLQITPQPGAVLQITWQDNSNQGMARPDDGLLVVAYNELRHKFEYRQQSARRDSLSYDFELPQEWTGESVQLWVSVTSADGKKAANSRYLSASSVLG